RSLEHAGGKSREVADPQGQGQGRDYVARRHITPGELGSSESYYGAAGGGGERIGFLIVSSSAHLPKNSCGSWIEGDQTSSLVGNTVKDEASAVRGESPTAQPRRDRRSCQTLACIQVPKF